MKRRSVVFIGLAVILTIVPAVLLLINFGWPSAVVYLVFAAIVWWLAYWGRKSGEGPTWM